MLEMKKVSISVDELEERESNPLTQTIRDTIGGAIGICDVGWVCAPIAYPCSPTLGCVPVVLFHLQKKCVPDEFDEF